MSQGSGFARLAPFIQEYIYRHGWTEFRPIQQAAAQVIFETEHHLLLSSATASGKTEAAFLPILTLLTEDQPESLGVLYVGPTKALINDQFWRLQGLLEEADFPVWHWHGDAPRSRKQRMLTEARGVLQITPESLESLLINKSGELTRLLHDLRFVVIDEVHVFMGSDRGQQVLCQLQRLRQFTRQEPRRIGLSATLGDYQQAERWLASGSQRHVVTPPIGKTNQRLRLSLEHFPRPVVDQPGAMAEPAVSDPYYQHIWQQTCGQKTLIFANNRGETEGVIAALRQIAQQHRLPDIYHVHHGSISAALREAAEAAMRAADQPAVTAATVTLELGIDLGQLSTVVQLDAPHSVSSFLQRLGRSGRRGEPSEMRLVTTETIQPDALLPAQLPWQLLQSIAVIQLYLEEQWIEPALAPTLPFSLLYHQTVSSLLQAGELPPTELARRVLQLSPFQQVSRADYRQLLLHLLSIDHLQQMEGGGLLVGLAGEKVARNYRFFAVFQDSDQYLVREDSRDIGQISNPPAVGDRIGLAGRTWEVSEVDAHRKLVLVKAIGGRAAISWPGSAAPIHGKVMRRMQQVLIEDADYRYLRPQAKEHLLRARTVARRSGVVDHNLIRLAPGLFAVLPWMGTLAFRALERCLRFLGKDELGVRGFSGLAPYYLLVHTDADESTALLLGLQNLARRLYDGSALLGERENPQLAKYDEYVPAELLRKAFVRDQLAIPEMQTIVQAWR